jgi:hypothetical protein
MPELSPQTDLIESLEAETRGEPVVVALDTQATVTPIAPIDRLLDEETEPEDDSELAGPDLVADDSDEATVRGESRVDGAEEPSESAQIIPLRATDES